MQDSMLAELKLVSLFQAVNDSDLVTLARRVKRKHLDPDRVVFKEGAAADSMYVVLSGSVKIFLSDETGKAVVLGTNKAGQYFGEMMRDHSPASASSRPVEPSE